MLPESAIRFCISTCEKFSKYTLPVIIPSLLENGLSSSQLLIINGGSEKWSVENYGDVAMICTPQNSFEYTPLIEVVEHHIDSEFWFLLHDTCVVGPSFKELVYSPPILDAEKTALRTCPSMSVGLYQMKYLMRHKDRLMSIKNTDNSLESIQRWKQWGVPNEDFMLWKLQDAPTHLYHKNKQPPEGHVFQGYEDLYGTGMKRRIEYYPQLDLLKAKSNWQGMQPQLCVDI
jgi:hypothetical protein